MSLRAKFNKASSRAKAILTPKRTSRSVSPAGQPTVPAESSASQTNAAPEHSTPILPDSTPVVTGPQPSASDAHDPISATQDAQAPSAPAIIVTDVHNQVLVLDEGNESRLSQGYAIFKSGLTLARDAVGPFPPARAAIGTLLTAIELVENVKGLQEEFAYAGGKLQSIRTIHDQHLSQLEPSESEALMDSLAQAMRIVEKIIRAKLARGLWKRIWESPSDVKAVADALRMLGDVVGQFIMIVTASTRSMLFQGLQDQVLDKLAFAETAPFLSVENARPCAEGTRAEFLANLLVWAMAVDKPHVCWVSGAAGSGKTTIAFTLCSFLRGLGLLGGSFFCSRDADDKRRSTKFIFSTLARSLAHHDAAYANSLARVLKEPGAGGVIASEQFTNLIAAPIRSAHTRENLALAPIRILVIDALDECGNDPTAVYNLIRRLLAESRGLRLKFLLTSRLEPHLMKAFKNADKDSYLEYGVQDIPNDAAKTDIRIYLETELEEFARLNDLPDSWPSETQLDALSGQADTLFIYASTARNYICQFTDDPVVRLDALIAVHAEPLRGIDPMYEFVLDQARQSKIDATWSITRQCLQAIVCLSHPLCLRDLGDLLGFDHGQVRTALSGLQSVLNIPSLDGSDSITVFHASFPDYLLDPARSSGKDWCLERAAGHRELLQRCMTVMKSNLRFNISNSRTSYEFNDEQPEKPEFGGALLYSCLHWIDHLEDCTDWGISALAELSELLMEHILHWLEVLSIAEEVQRAPVVMTRLLNWLHTHDSIYNSPDELGQANDPVTGLNVPHDEMSKFAKDAKDFVNRFAPAIEGSCPHIYLSALATTTRESTIWTKMSRMFKGSPIIMTQQMQDVCSSFVLRGHKLWIISVAVSRDGKRVVSGSSDGTIRLWDVATGAAIGDPIRGHERSVRSVAFSPDGTRVVSGSDDGTIRLRDAATGAAIGDPLCGHEDRVNSVAFSSDGMRVVSGSEDCTIRLWDATLGVALGVALRHENWVMSAAFSPDGMRVVSGSDDSTIRLWDTASGSAIGEPLRGHGGRVWSVAFSSDGTRVVSGSADRTIRLWDASTGAAIGGPLRGHADWVISVVFSPDGRFIASGSCDRTIRLWDGRTGASIDVFCGHEHAVTSVVFSSDGTRIVSGSEDYTVRLWDATPRAAIGGSLCGHEEEVNSVAFSPDGTRVVSASDDCTVRLWDAATGAAVGDALRGHEDKVNSVAFSPDGTRVVSGSNDLMIRLWDVVTGVAIGDPYRGHEKSVGSVGFSPDGMRIVSGSSDCTIYLWDVAAGAAIGNPLYGHEASVESVAFSPDGNRIVSGSADKTVRLWNAATGAAIGDPIRGHERSVRSVAFSPDGNSVVSGSDDETVRLWDATTGAAIGDHLCGHMNWVRSVAFSPDGTRVVSGSDDRTIRLWDRRTGAAIDMFCGHEHAVTSVVFSSDGTRVISSSKDRTIRLWDVATGTDGTAISEPLRGHECDVNSSAYSSDGTPDISGVVNRTSGRWAVGSQLQIGGPAQNINLSDVVSVYHSDLDEPSTIGLAHASHSILASDQSPRVAFSPDNAHATAIDALIPEVDRDPRDAFTLGKDGWLRGPNGELFLWILPEYRRGLWWPRTAAIMGIHPVMLDLSRFAHGENWTQVHAAE